MNSKTKNRRGKYTGSLPSKGNICYVNHCRSRLLQKIFVRLSYFKIPNPSQLNSKERSDSKDSHEKWKENLQIKQCLTIKSLRICELHFTADCFIRDLEAELTGRPIRKRLKENSVPTLFLSKEDNFVSDLQDDSLESIKKSEILNSLAKNLRHEKQSNNDVIHEVNSNSNFHEKKDPTIAPKILPNLNIQNNQIEVQLKHQISQSSSVASTTALSLLFTSENDMPSRNNILDKNSDSRVSNTEENEIQVSNRLQLQVMQLKQQVTNLNSQLSVQSQLVSNYKRKFSKREGVIKKLRSDVSQLKKERRKLRQREYMTSDFVLLIFDLPTLPTLIRYQMWLDLHTPTHNNENDENQSNISLHLRVLIQNIFF